MLTALVMMLVLLASPAALADKEEMVQIPSGSYLMGSPVDESWRSEDENQHSVTLSGFLMGAHEVTQGNMRR